MLTQGRMGDNRAVVRRTPRIRVSAGLARALDALPPRAQVALSGRPPIVVDGQTLDSGVQLMLAVRERLNQPAPETLSVPAGRAFTREEAAIAQGRLVPVAGVEDLTVAGATGPLPARLYRCGER